MVAAPVLNRAGRMAYGLAAVGIATQLNADRVAELGHDLREAAADVAASIVERGA
ncbi:hypothetical protein PUN4_510057 [Paraburkholderia unamae]|nr:hypothetical protein PUN4_510057 [Paraburkholderia unamae]